MGALAQAPRHSTSSHENFPSSDSSCGLAAIFSRQTATRSSAPQIMQEVVPQTCTCATLPTGCNWNMK